MDDWSGRVGVNVKLMTAGATMVFYTMNLDYPKLYRQRTRHYPAGATAAVV